MYIYIYTYIFLYIDILFSNLFCFVVESCSSSEFQCGDFQCITLRWKCDGMSDCVDGSDEVNCTMSDFPATTPPSDVDSSKKINTVEYFYCDGSHRLPKSYKCDGDKDCFDGSDEKVESMLYFLNINYNYFRGI